MSTVFILGAGATAGAKGLPVDKDFFQRSSNIISGFDFLPVAGEYLYGSNWVTQRLEELWSRIDTAYNLPPSISNGLTDRVLKLFQKRAQDETGLPAEAPRYYETYWQERIAHPSMPSVARYLFLFAGWELRKAICRVYGQANRGGETKYQELLAEYAGRGPISVIDFNYDVYLEEAWGNDACFYYADPSPGQDAVEILKPHGSLNWIHQKVWSPYEEIVVAKEIYPIPSWGYGPGGFSQASIIPMARAKREFTPNEESEAIRSRYGGILRRCEDVLRQAQHICIVGYSFPPGDQHFQGVLSDVGTNRATPLLTLKHIGLDGTVQEWTTKLREIFGITFDPEVRLDGF